MSIDGAKSGWCDQTLIATSTRPNSYNPIKNVFVKPSFMLNNTCETRANAICHGSSHWLTSYIKKVKTLL
jgi:hypothetical protein